MRINNNISAMNTYSRLTSAQSAQSKSLEKLSSGLRINRAGDDAAGLAISEKMRGQIGGLNQAVRNAQDGISLIQTAEGALNETHSILNRMRELAVQSANDTNTDADRNEIQKEIGQLSEEITRIANDTQFNTKNLLNNNGDARNLNFQIGANKNQSMDLTIEGMKADDLEVNAVDTYTAATAASKTIADLTITAKNAGLDGNNISVVFAQATHATDTNATANVSGNTITITKNSSDGNTTLTNDEIAAAIAASTEANSLVSVTIADTKGGEAQAADSHTLGGATAHNGINVSTMEGANDAIQIIDDAIATVSAERSKLGAVQNRLDHTINNLTTTSENLSAAESRIRDVDMAKEMMEFTKNNILNQASTAMLAQANQMPQGVLQLLG